MALDGFLIKRLQYELNEKLALGRVDKIYQTDKDQLLFNIRNEGNTYKLVISCSSDHPGIYISSGTFENPSNPSSLCMLFRKHLQGSKIIKVTQHETERVVKIYFEASDELGFKVERILSVELLGRYSNIILLDESMRILDSVKRGSLDSNSDRLILPGQRYSYPPAKDKVPFVTVLEKEFTFNSEEDIANTLQGISIPLAYELLERGNPCNALQGLIGEIETLKPRVYFKDKNNIESPKDIHIVPMSIYGDKYLAFNTVSEALDFYYSKRTTSNRLEQKKSNLKKSLNGQIKKVKLKKRRLLEDIDSAKNSGHFQIYGELLMANLNMAKTGDKSVVLNNYYTNEKIRIPLDEKISPTKNAQNYFKKFAKSKRAIIEKGAQVEKVILDIAYLESTLTFLEKATTYQEVDLIGEELFETGFIHKKSKEVNGRKKNKKITLLELESKSGKKILVGRNNKENDYLTFTLASRGDFWFHTKDIPGSHVVLFLNGQEPTEEEIREVSSIAAYYSKAGNSENVPVDYVKIKYVKKIPGGKPGMVIFTNNQTIYTTPK